MKTINITIKGSSPLMLCRFPEENETDKATRGVIVNHGSPRERATKAAYIKPDGTYYFPGTAIPRMLREAASNFKMKGTRRSAKYVVPAAVLMLNDAVTIRDEEGKPSKDFEVDSRPVVIPATKGRIMAHRPRWDTWTAQFSLRINEMLLPVDFINEVMVAASQQIGIGAFRPEKGGPFGTFIITKWEEQKQ